MTVGVLYPHRDSACPPNGVPRPSNPTFSRQLDSRRNRRTPNHQPSTTSATVSPSPHHAVERAVAAEEELAGALDDVLERVDVADRLQPARRQRHRQQDPREQQHGQHDALSSGANASSLFSVSASAYETDANAAPSSATTTRVSTTPEHRRAQPERDRHQHEQRALHQQDDDVAQHPARAAAPSGWPA